MTDKDGYDENEQDFNRIRWRRDKLHILYCSGWVREKTEGIGSKYNIESRDELGVLLRQLAVLVSYPSNITVKPGKVTVPRDFETWKEAKAKLKRLGKALADVCDGLPAALEDHVQSAVLLNAVDPIEMVDLVDMDHLMETGRIDDVIVDVDYLRQLRELVDRAAAVNSSAGNRPNPDWHTIAADLCREFWVKIKGEQPNSYFNELTKPRQGESVENKTTEPANEFSRWFCDMMHAVADLTVTECKTALSKDQAPLRPAFRSTSTK